MTEAEWLEGTNPAPMLESLRGNASDRKLRLFAVACCQRFQRRLADKAIRRIVEVVEAFADGLATQDQLAAARNVQQHPKQWPTFWSASNDDAFKAAWFTHVNANRFSSRSTGNRAPKYHASLLRDIFGNPFHRLVLDPSWRTEAVVGLARGMYESRDFAPMPELADALERAGCADADVLGHCRGEGPHVRGCWVVDLVLGKS